MPYRAVGTRCAVDFDEFGLPISMEVAIALLSTKGFQVVPVDLITLARQCIGISTYRRSARLREATGTFDCSGFVKWLYGRRGIWLPRRSVQQRELGEVVSRENVNKEDVIFVSGLIDYYVSDPSDGVGHVGIATGNGTVIHAANKKSGIVESSIGVFCGADGLRGIRRYVPSGRRVVTFETPSERDVETSDDIRWIVLQSL